MERPARQAWTLRDAAVTALPVLLAAAVLLPLLGHRPLTAWDEGIYAEISREMVQGHSWQSWWVPHWNGQPWFEKPPLALWLTAGSLRLFGVNTWAARLPSALAGVALGAVLFQWLRRRFDTVTGVTGTCLLLSGFGFQHAARVGETDTLLSLFCFCAVLGLAGVLRSDPRGWLLFWTSFGLAVMTKGAAAFTLPLATLALATIRGPAIFRFGRSFGLGLLLFCCLAVPWHLSMLLRFHQAFAREYLGLHVLHRATTAMEGHGTGFFFFLWVLLLSCFPFALVFPWALVAALRRGPTGEQGAVAPVQAPTSSPLESFAVFALVTLVLFSVARTRLPHYIDPLYAPLAAVTAVWLIQRLRPVLTASPGRLWFTALALAGVYVAGAALTAPARRRLHSPKLPNGQRTPDNREAVSLERRVARTRGLELPPGPLLVWRRNGATPVTTDAFYSQRLVQVLGEAASGCRDGAASGERYTPCPAPWSSLRRQRYLLLLDREFSDTVPAGWAFQPWVQGPLETEGILLPEERGAEPLRR